MTNAPANTARTGRHLGGRYLWLACHLCLGLGAHRRADGIDGSVSATRNSHPAKIGFLRQFRLFFDRRIQLGVADVVFGAAASYVFYTYLSPIMRDEIGVPERYISIGLVIYGCACLWSNLYGGKLADKGHGVEPLTHIRPIYCVQAVCLCLLAFASLLAVGATTLLRPYVER